MLSIPVLTAIVISVLLAFFWYAGAKARERATHIVKNVCKKHGVQLLDGTTILKKYTLSRDSSGHLGLQRQFDFDFFQDGARLTGRLVLCRYDIIECYLEKPLPSKTVQQTDLFTAANEPSNVIKFPPTED